MGALISAVANALPGHLGLWFLGILFGAIGVLWIAARLKTGTWN